MFVQCNHVGLPLGIPVMVYMGMMSEEERRANIFQVGCFYWALGPSELDSPLSRLLLPNFGLGEILAIVCVMGLLEGGLPAVEQGPNAN